MLGLACFNGDVKFKTIENCLVARKKLKRMKLKKTEGSDKRDDNENQRVIPGTSRRKFVIGLDIL